MNVNFNYNSPEAADPIVLEQVWGEKPGGGLVANQTYRVKEGTAVGLTGGKHVPIKAYRLVKAVAVEDTSIEIAKGSGIATGDIIGHGTKAVACSAVDTTTNATKDVVTVTLEVAIANDTVLYQAKAASVAGVQEVKAGYYDSEETADGALKVVAANAGVGEVLLTTVQASYHGSKIIAADDYVVLVSEAVAGVTAEPAEPKYQPLYVTGQNIEANLGDQMVRLVNGANLRKETANISAEVAALLPTINLV